ncbi:hypothetical protein QYE76_008756 [Lolium multiflorum]|uniref:RNase H type-1 domain-containing protein n=1 Tax=Lolium multiflorum TaxID=4521 RepID=A0AAD8X2Y2_LOLMU|nr:hypothetical protein QYE76_008756 [Lolium multiflorum]
MRVGQTFQAFLVLLGGVLGAVLGVVVLGVAWPGRGLALPWSVRAAVPPWLRLRAPAPRSCQVEADALEVIQACNGDVDINSPYSAILADYFQKASEMEEIAFLHRHREANQVAHELARLAYSSRENRVWEGGKYQTHSFPSRTTLTKLRDDDLDETPVPHLGTTSPINDHPPPPPSQRRHPAVSSVSLRRTTIACPEALSGSPPRGKRGFKSSTSL